MRLPPTVAEQAEGLPIAALEVVGNRRVVREDVLSYLREKIGQLFKVDNLTADVHALWDSGFFEDVQVDLTTSDRGVVLRFIVRERPNIKTVEYSGNDEIESDKLTEVVEVKANTILSLPAVRRSVQKIKDAYAEKGYFLADVQYEIQPQRENEVIVKFRITEHQPVTVRRVTFIGNDHMTDDELRDADADRQRRFPLVRVRRALPAGRVRARRLDAERRLLRQGIPERASRHPSGDAQRRPAPGSTLRSSFTRGLATRSGSFESTNAAPMIRRGRSSRLGGRRALQEMMHAHSGDYFNRAELIKDLQAVRTLYRDAGFANVEAEPETELDPIHSEVDIVVPIKRGPPVTIERIEVKGNTKTRDKVIRREMEVQEGQLFSETGIENSKRRITALGFFERVDLSTEQGSAPDKLVINVEVSREIHGHLSGGRRV